MSDKQPRYSPATEGALHGVALSAWRRVLEKAEAARTFIALGDMGYSTAERLYLCGDPVCAASWKQQFSKENP